MFSKSIFLFVFAALLQCSYGFKPSSTAVRLGGNKVVSTFGTSALYAVKKPTAEEEAMYWQGEWVCADCGYIYDRDIDGGGLWFEQQKRGFICPQCSAPRKRYAKKVGETWGVTRDGGDLPIYAFSFLGIAITAWFALVYVPTM